jgi:hypothetical protein
MEHRKTTENKKSARCFSVLQSVRVTVSVLLYRVRQYIEHVDTLVRYWTHPFCTVEIALGQVVYRISSPRVLFMLGLSSVSTECLNFAGPRKARPVPSIVLFVHSQVCFRKIYSIIFCLLPWFVIFNFHVNNGLFAFSTSLLFLFSLVDHCRRTGIGGGRCGHARTASKDIKDTF